ncbi:NADH-quinone oxidoreductase subunit H [bacterium]|nr:NADH-quinone oxidoreductase subunit H [bacterium]
MLDIFINIFILLTVPFLMIGVIKKTKAFWSGRKGINIFQPFWDFLRLLNKETVYSSTTSWIFKITPIINFSVIFFASLFVPMANGLAIINIPFAFIIFSYVLALGKFFTLISALDTGSSFEGMGASREACFSTLVEPAFFIAIGSITALTQNYTFQSLKLILENAGIYGYLVITLAIITLFIMLLIECSRVPVDDPATHLELTMIHEVMILDNSGIDLALILWTSAIKMFLFASLISALIIPTGLPQIISILLFLSIIFIISIIIGTIESSTARYRMTHVFEFVFIMSITALLILTLVTYKLYGN